MEAKNERGFIPMRGIHAFVSASLDPSVCGYCGREAGNEKYHGPAEPAPPASSEPLRVRIDNKGDVHVDSADSYYGFATFHGKDDVAKNNAELFIAAYTAKHGGNQ